LHNVSFSHVTRGKPRVLGTHRPVVRAGRLKLNFASNLSTESAPLSVTYINASSGNLLLTKCVLILQWLGANLFSRLREGIT
jgi:hypothetical protein